MNHFKTVPITFFFNKYLFLIILSCQISVTANSQDKAPLKFGKVNKEDFYIKSSVVDSNANAVVVYNKGDISFEGNETGWFMYVYKRTCRILISNKNGLDAATVEVNLYKNDETKEKVENLSATTYNLENGLVMETKLNTRDVFEEKIDKNYYSKKFTMPAVKEGSIIEYSYTIKSNFIFNLPAWDFQSTDYPVLWSEYNITIPGLLSYMTFFQGYHTYAIDQSTNGFKNYSISRQKDIGRLAKVDERFYVSSPTISRRWVMKDLPSFKGENFMISPLNFIDKISFQLYQTYDGEKSHDVANTWQKAIEELTEREDFGKPLIEDNRWLDDVLAPIIEADDNELTKAKKMFLYVQKNYTCTNEYSKFIKTSLKEVVKNRSGTVGDINLLLIAMLKHKNIKALPVLLSTRAVGRVPKNYPMMERLNYVIAKVEINKIDYYLDATLPFLPFGKLPLKCYNGSARVISKDSVVVNLDADLINESHIVNIFLTNSTTGELQGSYLNRAGFFESLDIRNTIAKSSFETFKKDFQQKFSGDLQVSNIEIDSLQFSEANLSVAAELSLKNFKDADIVYFNPILNDVIYKNPFYALKRMYPIELPYLSNKVYSLVMEIPKGYKIDELPKSVRLNLNENEGMFEYIVNADKNSILLSCKIQLKKTTFLSEDYDTLRDFYAFIVNKHAEQIVFKKIK